MQAGRPKAGLRSTLPDFNKPLQSMPSVQSAPLNTIAYGDTAEKLTDAAEREQKELAHFAEPRGGRVVVDEPTANS